MAIYYDNTFFALTPKTIANMAGSNIAQRKVIKSDRNPINGGPITKPKYATPVTNATPSAAETWPEYFSLANFPVALIIIGIIVESPIPSKNQPIITP